MPRRRRPKEVKVRFRVFDECANVGCVKRSTLRCSKCHSVSYCGDASCQSSHYRRHRQNCERIFAAMTEVSTLAEGLHMVPLICPSRLFFFPPETEEERVSATKPVNLFEAKVGYFWEDPRSRDYLIARFKLVEAIGKIDSFTAVAHAAEHCKDLAYLNKGDGFSIDRLPTMLVLLDRIQECYDFLKFFFRVPPPSEDDQGDRGAAAFSKGGLLFPPDEPTGEAYLSLENEDVGEEVEVMNLDLEGLEAHRLLDLVFLKIAALQKARRFRALETATAAALQGTVSDVLRRVAEYDGFKGALDLKVPDLERQRDQLFSLLQLSQPALLPAFVAGKVAPSPPPQPEAFDQGELDVLFDSAVKTFFRPPLSPEAYLVESRLPFWKKVPGALENIKDFLKRGVSVPTRPNEKRDAAAAANAARVYLHGLALKEAVAYLRDHRADTDLSAKITAFGLAEHVLYTVSSPEEDPSPLSQGHGVAAILTILHLQRANTPDHRALFFGDVARPDTFTDNLLPPFLKDDPDDLPRRPNHHHHHHRGDDEQQHRLNNPPSSS